MANLHDNFKTNMAAIVNKAYLDIWKSRGLTIYGKVLIIKSLGLSSLIYSISNVNVPKKIVSMVKDKIFRFLWGK